MKLRGLYFLNDPLFKNRDIMADVLHNESDKKMVINVDSNDVVLVNHLMENSFYQISSCENILCNDHYNSIKALQIHNNCVLETIKYYNDEFVMK